MSAVNINTKHCTDAPCEKEEEKAIMIGSHLGLRAGGAKKELAGAGDTQAGEGSETAEHYEYVC